jgi:cation diffusion facilitator CzcD-associated flavoprotein CzcO
VTVFEAGSSPGGVWQYSDGGDSDPSGRDPRRRRAHASLYASLRCNLPRELMGFTDLPFTPAAMDAVAAAAVAAAGGGEADADALRSRDARRFCGHAEVLAYLRCFARAFQLEARAA